MAPATGEAGGTVVAWTSLENAAALMTFLPDSLDTNWAMLPFFAERYGSYYFFVSHPNVAIPPPVSNPELGTLDAAMIATLQASLADMNQRVADSVARSRNAPPPAPTDPMSRKFWRIRADWSLDSDGDGSPDWMEFVIAADPAGFPVGAGGLRGDAFDADTDGNGVADGMQLDYDQDGVADAKDIAPADASASFEIAPLPRYALFPITNAEPPSGWPRDPFQISNRGTVLYQNDTWTAGTWADLIPPSGGYQSGPQSAFARAINDDDVILGYYSSFC